MLEAYPGPPLTPPIPKPSVSRCAQWGEGGGLCPGAGQPSVGAQGSQPLSGLGEALHLNPLTASLVPIAGLVLGCGLWGLDGVPRGSHAAHAP